MDDIVELTRMFVRYHPEFKQQLFNELTPVFEQEFHQPAVEDVPANDGCIHGEDCNINPAVCGPNCPALEPPSA